MTGGARSVIVSDQDQCQPEGVMSNEAPELVAPEGVSLLEIYCALRKRELSQSDEQIRLNPVQDWQGFAQRRN